MMHTFEKIMKFIILIAIFSSMVASSHQLSPSIVHEKVDMLMELIKTKYPEYCSMSHAGKVRQLDLSIFRGVLATDSDVVSVKLKKIFERYKNLLEQVCDEIWNDKLDHDNDNDNMFKKNLDFIEEFEDQLPMSTSHSGKLDSESIQLALSNFLAIKVREASDYADVTREDVLIELKTRATALKSIIYNDAGPVCLLRKIIHDNDSSCDHYMNLYTICVHLTSMEAPGESNPTNIEMKIHLPTKTVSDHIELEHRPKFEDLAGNLAYIERINLI